MSYLSYQLEGVEIIAGIGAFAAISDSLKKLKVKKPLLVTDENIYAAGGLNLAEETLKEAGIPYVIYHNVRPDPYSYMADDGTAYFKQEKCDGIISIGGGSVMDIGKVISVMSVHEGRALEYTRRWENPKPITKKGCPIINVPTTSGTGSETSLFAVLTNRDNHRKMTLESKYILSDIAILDPTLAVTLPQEIMVSCFMDALGHASEAYCHATTIENNSVVSDITGLKAVELLCANVEKVYNNPNDLEARMNMMWGALLGGIALNIGAGESHALGAMLSKYYNLPHGYSIGVSLPACMEFCIPSCPQRYYDIAKAMGAHVIGMSLPKGALAGVDHLRRMLSRMKFPTMSDYTTMDDVEKFSKECSENSCCVLNKRMTTQEDVEKTFLIALTKG